MLNIQFGEMLEILLNFVRVTKFDSCRSQCAIQEKLDHRVGLTITRLIAIIFAGKFKLLDWGYSGPYKEGQRSSKKREEISPRRLVVSEQNTR